MIIAPMPSERVEVFPAGREKKFDALPAARERNAADDENEHQDEKRRHENLRKLFNARFDAAQHDEGRHEEEDEKVRIGAHAVGDKAAEIRAERVGVGSDAAAHEGVDGVLDAPAAHDRVKGKDQKDGENADAAEEAPGLAADEEEAAHGAALAGASHGEFGNEERNPDGHGKEDVGDHEDRSAVGARHVLELPDRAESDRRAG